MTAADEIGLESYRMLPPDDEDVRLIRDGVLPRCAHCAGTPSTFARFFEHSGIYQAHVHCSWCSISVFVNSRGLEDARNQAIAKWSKRVPATRQDRITALEREVEGLRAALQEIADSQWHITFDAVEGIRSIARDALLSKSEAPSHD